MESVHITMNDFEVYLLHIAHAKNPVLIYPL
jgi:hypothetical protein